MMVNWQTKKLGDIGTFFKGSGIPKDSAKSGDLPAVRYGELYTSFDIFINQVRSSIDQSTAMSAAKILKRDILFAGSGETVEEIGKSAVYQLDKEGYAGGDIVIMRPGSDQDSRFLGQALNSDEARKQLRKFGQGQSVVHVYRKDLEKLELLLPEKPEQERIVGVLEVWDEYIEKLEQKIALKEQLKKGLMQQLLTGNRRLPGFKGEWQIEQLGKIAEVNPAEERLPETFSYIDLEIVVDGRLIRKPKMISKQHAPSRAQRLLRRGDVLFQTVRPYQKNNYYFDIDNGRYVASTGYAQLRAKTSSRFLYHFLQNDEFVKSVLRMCTGSNYPAITSGDLAKIKILYPSREEQEAIERILSTLDSEISVLGKKTISIREQKNYLLKNLITGTIRTPETLKPKGVSL
jgi:type I restriction enzyme S subunit